MPIRLDLGVMQRQSADDVPALYRGLLRSSLKRASASSGDTNALRARLAALASEAERLAGAGGAGAGARLRRCWRCPEPPRCLRMCR